MQGNSSNYDSLTSRPCLLLRRLELLSPTIIWSMCTLRSILLMKTERPGCARRPFGVNCSKSLTGRVVLSFRTLLSYLAGVVRVSPAFSACRSHCLSSAIHHSTTGHKPLILTNAKKAYENRRVGSGLAIARLNEVGALSLQTTFLATIRGGGYQRVLASSYCGCSHCWKLRT